jgi:hypothetical protein
MADLVITLRCNNVAMWLRGTVSLQQCGRVTPLRASVAS